MSQTLQPPSTASMAVNSGQSGVFPVSFGYYPREGSRCVTAQYNWTAQAGYAEDLSQLVARGVETTIQSVFVDNSANNQTVTIYVSGSGQVLLVPPLSQGVFPLYFTGTPGYTITVPTTAAGVTRLFLLNVPANAAGIWPSSAVTGLTGTYQAAPVELGTGASAGLLLDAYGGLAVDTEAAAPVYVAVGNVTAPVNATDILTIYGSATKTIRIHQVFLVIPAVAATTLLVVKRGAVDTGASTAIPSTAHDSLSAAGTASAATWPTSPVGLGAAIGAIERQDLGAAMTLDYRYGVTDQSVVLRSVAQGLVCSFGGTNAAPAFINFKIKWSEV